MGLAAAVLCPTQAFALCDNNTPATGNSVTCNTTGGDDHTGVANASANNVSVLVDSGAAISTTGTQAINLGTGANISISDNATVTASGADAITIGSGTINISGPGTGVSAQSANRNTVTTTGALTLNIGTGAAVHTLSNTGQKAVYYAGGGGDSVAVNVQGSMFGGGTLVDFGSANATFTLHDTASITGNIVAGAGSSDAFVLSGTGSGTFNLSDLGAGQQYQGFDTFSKTGSGTWTLSGTSTTDWTISAGTLATTISGLDDVVNDGTLRIQGAGGTFAGDISGSGIVNFTGGNTFALSGSNSYTGGTTLTTSGTTLQVATSTFQGDVNAASGTSLVFNQSTSGTYADDISGAGAVSATGTGVLTFSGTSTYTGGTTITGGARIDINAENNLGDASGALTLNAGTLHYNNAISTSRDTILTGAGTIDSNVAVTMSGAISGAGALTKTGTGTLTLSGTNSYSGGTTISAGTLIGSTTSLQGDITNNAALTFNQGTTGTFADDISGTGTLTKTGAGNLVLSGTNSYSGATAVNAGRLTVNGTSTASTITVEAGGELGGTGTTGTVIANGTLAPGNSIGTINISGALTFNTGSTYEVEINDAGQSDKTVATGAITINGGTVSIFGATGDYATSTDYTILEGSSVTGTFASVIDDLAFMDAALTYNSNNVVLTMTRNATDFDAVAADSVQADVADAIEQLGSGNPIYDAFESYTADEAQQAFEMLSGESYAGAGGYTNAVAGNINGIVAARMVETNNLPVTTPPQTTTAPADIEPAAGNSTGITQRLVKNTSFWGHFVGTTGQSSASGSAPSQSRNSHGIVIGGDRKLDNNMQLGAYGGITYGNINTQSQNAGADVQSYTLGTYASKPVGKLQVSGGASGTFHNMDTKRHINISGFQSKATAQTEAATASGFVEVSRKYRLKNNTAVEPYARMAASYTRINGFTEEGGGAANLSVDKSENTDISQTLGIRATKHISGPDNFSLDLEANAGWQHGYGSGKNANTMRFSGQADPFTVYGNKDSRDTAILGLSVNSRLNDMATGYLRYDGLLDHTSQDHSFTMGIKLPFPAQ